MKTLNPTTTVLFFFFLLPCLFNVSIAEEKEAASSTTTNPFTPRASLIRYWNKEIDNGIPTSPFLLSKASPLNVVELASFSKLASSNSLGTNLQSFCFSANLFCYPSLGPSLEKNEEQKNYHYNPKIYIFGSSPPGASASTVANKWVVEPGTFFREKMLQKGMVMPMPDIRDKLPKRSFLPQTITSQMPFSSSKIGDIKAIFHAADDSAMEKIIKDALEECERDPSAGETKRCMGSAEDMIDFATSVLGRHIALRTTDNTKGSKGNIMIGEVTKINGGTVNKSISCHQSLYPYLLYFCHSVPNVRVYEADLLDPNSKVKINHGIAICHIDTSAWDPTHEAFLSLGSEPGKIEVCHWIFENDVTWTIAD